MHAPPQPPPQASLINEPHPADVCWGAASVIASCLLLRQHVAREAAQLVAMWIVVEDVQPARLADTQPLRVLPHQLREVAHLHAKPWLAVVINPDLVVEVLRRCRGAAVPRGQVLASSVALIPAGVLEHAVVGPGLGGGSQGGVPGKWLGAMLCPQLVVEVQGVLEPAARGTCRRVRWEGCIIVNYSCIRTYIVRHAVWDGRHCR